MHKQGLLILPLKYKIINMKKVIFIILLIVVFSVVVVFINSKKDNRGAGTQKNSQFQQDGNIGTVTPMPTPTPIPEASATPVPASKVFDIIYAGSKLSQQNITIAVGDTVRFINNDNIMHWPASGIHPTHQICPGFDSLKGLSEGEIYSFTFKEAKECPFHDHLNADAAFRGKITITE